MKKSTVLRQERQAHIDAQKTIVEGAKDEKGVERSLNADEVKNFDAAQAEIKRLTAEIERAEQFEANQRAAAAAAGAPVAKPEEKEMGKMKKRFSLHKALRSQTKNGVLDGVELEIHQETAKRAAEANINITGVAIPAEMRADGQTVTQDSGAYGANLVPEDQQGVIEFLRPKPILESMGARFMTGLQGNLAFPTNDGGITASWEGEIDTLPATKNAYGKKTMEPHRLGAKTLLSLQNLMQSAPSLEMMTVSDIRAVISNKIDEAGINGSGSGDIPEGILNTTGIGSVVGGTNGAAPTWDHIVDLETAIYSANAEAANMGYLINTQTKGRLKKTKHTAGDLAYLMAGDNTINGYKVGVSNLVPNDLTKGTADPVSAAIFGDFKQLLMGQWGFYDLKIDDVTLIDQGYVRVIANTFVDVLVRQAKAFAAIKDWDLS